MDLTIHLDWVLVFAICFAVLLVLALFHPFVLFGIFFGFLLAYEWERNGGWKIFKKR